MHQTAQKCIVLQPCPVLKWSGSNFWLAATVVRQPILTVSNFFAGSHFWKSLLLAGSHFWMSATFCGPLLLAVSHFWLLAIFSRQLTLYSSSAGLWCIMPCLAGPSDTKPRQTRDSVIHQQEVTMPKHCTALHCTKLNCIAQHSTTLSGSALRCTAPHCTKLHCN